MIKYIFLFFYLLQSFAYGSIKSDIINNFKSIENITFDFKQKIGDKIEDGRCTIVYPKKILCIYNDIYKKVLVSNGKSLVINPNKNNQYYRYNLEQTPLHLILDKDFIIQKIDSIQNKIINEKQKIRKDQKINKKEKNTSIARLFKNLIVIIITLIAIILVIDTFKNSLNNYFPGIILFLDNLYETINDLKLFFLDLIK